MERKYIGIKFYDVDYEGRILECVRVKFMKENGYTIECSIINDDEEDDDDSFTIKIVLECIEYKDCHQLNKHVRMVQKTSEEETPIVSSPGRASARKVDTVELPSDDSDSDLSTPPISHTKFTKGKRKIPTATSKSKKRGNYKTTGLPTSYTDDGSCLEKAIMPSTPTSMNSCEIGTKNDVRTVEKTFDK